MYTMLVSSIFSFFGKTGHLPGYIPTARVRLRIDCETISGPGLQGGPTSEIVLASQEHEAGGSVQGMTMAPITSRKRKAETGFPTEQESFHGFPSVP